MNPGSTRPWNGPGRGPRWWRGTRAARELAVGGLLRVDVGSTLAVLGALARAGQWSGILGPAADRLAVALPHVPRARIPSLAREIAARSARTRALMLLTARGLGGRIAPLVHWPPDDPTLASAGREPLVVCTYHIGAFPAVGAALAARGVATFVLKNEDASSSQPEGRRWRAVQALKALRTLSEGGTVLLTPDGGASDDVRRLPVLHRRLRFHAGVEEFARRARARVVFAIARWSDDHPGVDVSSCQAPGSGDLLAAAAAHLEAHLRAHPEDASPFLLKALLHPGTAPEVAPPH